MTNDKLERANVLNQLIKDEKDKLIRWENIARFKETADVVFKDKKFSFIHMEHVPFDIVKLICIQKYTERINELQKEFDSL